MPLFIHQAPFFEQLIGKEGLIRQVEVRMRIAIGEPFDEAPPPESKARKFVLDTAADYVSVFPADLHAYGLRVPGPSGGQMTVILMDGSTTEQPMRDATLWLYSNLPKFADKPHRIDLNGGVVVLPASPHQAAGSLNALLGMNALIDAGLRIELDAKHRTYSVWIE